MLPQLFDCAPQDVTAPKGIHYAECPHCHNEVQIRADGKCIACGKNQLETAGLNPEQTVLTIENVHRLPSCCFVCGDETSRMQRFTWNYRINPHTLPPWMIPFVLLMSFIPGSQYRSSERVRMPVCGACAKPARRVRPVSVWSGLECRMLVHRRFRERFEAINGRARLEWEADQRVSAGHPSAARGVMGEGIRL